MSAASSILSETPSSDNNKHKKKLTLLVIVHPSGLHTVRLLIITNRLFPQGHHTRYCSRCLCSAVLFFCLFVFCASAEIGVLRCTYLGVYCSSTVVLCIMISYSSHACSNKQLLTAGASGVSAEPSHGKRGFGAANASVTTTRTKQLVTPCRCEAQI